MTLPYDIRRCRGVGFPCEGAPEIIDWRDGCETCQRRTAPHEPDGWQWMIDPPPIIVFECEYVIPTEPCDTQGGGD